METTAPTSLLPTARPDAATADPPSTSESARTAQADFDSFLNLLTAQLRYQDPLQPLDSTQFVAQLASFSTVEQLVGVNERLDALAADSDGTDIGALTGWIGNRVSLDDGSFRSGGGEVELTIPAVPGATSAAVSIVTPSGTPIRSFAVDPAGGTVTWDGLGPEGQEIPAAELRARVDYFAGEESLGAEPATIFRTVVGLLSGAEGPRLELSDGGIIDPDTVSAVRAAPAEDG